MNTDAALRERLGTDPRETTATRDMLGYARAVLEREAASSTASGRPT